MLIILFITQKDLEIIAPKTSMKYDLNLSIHYDITNYINNKVAHKGRAFSVQIYRCSVQNQLLHTKIHRHILCTLVVCSMAELIEFASVSVVLLITTS